MITGYNWIAMAFLVGAGLAALLLRLKTFRTIVDHTLKNPRTGEWSRKNLCGFASFAYSIYYCQSCLVRGVDINVEVLLVFNATSLACLGISSWEKFKLKKPAGAGDTTQP